MSLLPLEKAALGAICALGLLVLATDIPSRRAPHAPAAPPPTPMALATAAAEARAAAGREEAARATVAGREEEARLAAVQNPPETAEALPPGHGREEVFARCTACHSTAIIRRSGLQPAAWDELMDWMTEKHGMPPLEGPDRALVVDYLARSFPPRRAPRGGANPFLN